MSQRRDHERINAQKRIARYGGESIFVDFNWLSERIRRNDGWEPGGYIKICAACGISIHCDKFLEHVLEEHSLFRCGYCDKKFRYSKFIIHLKENHVPWGSQKDEVMTKYCAEISELNVTIALSDVLDADLKIRKLLTEFVNTDCISKEKKLIFAIRPTA